MKIYSQLGQPWYLVETAAATRYTTMINWWLYQQHLTSSARFRFKSSAVKSRRACSELSRAERAATRVVLVRWPSSALSTHFRSSTSESSSRCECSNKCSPAHRTFRCEWKSLGLMGGEGGDVGKGSNAVNSPLPQTWIYAKLKGLFRLAFRDSEKEKRNY